MHNHYTVHLKLIETHIEILLIKKKEAERSIVKKKKKKKTRDGEKLKCSN